MRQQQYASSPLLRLRRLGHYILMCCTSVTLNSSLLCFKSNRCQGAHLSAWELKTASGRKYGPGNRWCKPCCTNRYGPPTICLIYTAGSGARCVDVRLFFPLSRCELCMSHPNSVAQDSYCCNTCARDVRAITTHPAAPFPGPSVSVSRQQLLACEGRFCCAHRCDLRAS